MKYAFDGFDKRHLPLDEVTAPYTTTNFIGTMEFHTATDMDQVIVVCPRLATSQELNPGLLTDYIAMRYDASETVDGTIPILEALRAPIIDAPPVTGTGQYSSVRARLHNLSVRLECLGTNTGLYPPGSAYMGTVPCIETGHSSTGAVESLSIKTAWADDSIQVGYLKSTPAASLVEKPVSLNAAIAENVSYKTWRDLYVPPSTTDLGSSSFCSSLEPIVIYIPRCGAGTTVVDYRLVVGQQWCSRHPHNVMLRSTQKQHPPTSPDRWHRAVAAVTDIGPTIAEHAVGPAIELMGAGLRRMLTNGPLALPAPV